MQRKKIMTVKGYDIYSIKEFGQTYYNVVKENAKPPFGGGGYYSLAAVLKAKNIKPKEIT